MLRIQPKDNQVDGNKQELNTLVCAVNEAKLELEKLDTARQSATKLLIEVEKAVVAAQDREVTVLKSLDESKKIHQDYITQIESTNAEIELTKNKSQTSLNSLKEQESVFFKIIKDLQDKYDSLRKMYNDDTEIYKKSLEDLNIQLSAVNIEIESRLKEIYSHNVDIKSLEQKKSDLTREIEVFKSELEKNKALNQSTSTLVDTRKESLDKLDRIFIEKSESIKELGAIITSITELANQKEIEIKALDGKLLSIAIREEKINAIIPKIKDIANKAGLTLDL